ncbi:MAG TPA: hypothetical protein PK170_10330 [Anaerolineae bacterium]|nr:hypothetical protein [Anaerolineae bacterium]
MPLVINRQKKRMMMEIILNTSQTTYDLNDVRSALRAALRRETVLAHSRRKAFEQTCREYEDQFSITTEQFLNDFEAGKLGDDLVYFDWYAAKRGFDLWDRRTKILDGVSM